jgi:hypothetical protein
MVHFIHSFDWFAFSFNSFAHSNHSFYSVNLSLSLSLSCRCYDVLLNGCGQSISWWSNVQDIVTIAKVWKYSAVTIFISKSETFLHDNKGTPNVPRRYETRVTNCRQLFITQLTFIGQQRNRRIIEVRLLLQNFFSLFIFSPFHHNNISFFTFSL